MEVVNKVSVSINSFIQMEFVMIVKIFVPYVLMKNNVLNARKATRINLGFVFSYVTKDILETQI